MRSLAPLLATVLVAGLSVATVAAAVGAFRWGQWLVTAGGVLGTVGVALTAAAFVNLFVPRTCAPDEHNLPAVSLVLGHGECLEEGLGQAQLTVLSGQLATTAVAARRLRTIDRRSAPVVPPQTPS